MPRLRIDLVFPCRRHAAAAGDERAFLSLYQAHATPLFRLALAMTGGRDDAAEDIVQEAWMRVVRKLGSFAGRSSARTWLRAFVVRCALERLRADGRLGAPAPQELPDPRSPGDIHAGVDLERAFAALPDGYRTVLVLHDVEGYRHDEISSLLGIAPGTSKSQLSRAKEWLRRALGAGYRNRGT